MILKKNSFQLVLDQSETISQSQMFYDKIDWFINLKKIIITFDWCHFNMQYVHQEVMILYETFCLYELKPRDNM